MTTFLLGLHQKNDGWRPYHHEDGWKMQHAEIMAAEGDKDEDESEDTRLTCFMTGDPLHLVEAATRLDDDM
jgi:hypothetical protein